MAESPLGIGGGRPVGGVDVLKEALGLGSPRGTGGGAGASSVAGGGGGKHGPFGPRGQRMLPADFPQERLDFAAPRGTYLDILV